MYTHEALLAKNGITPLLAWPTFSVELIGGCAILLGWYTRQWAAFLLIFLAVVVWIKWPVGWLYSNAGGGWEYPLFWLMAQAALVLAGSGASRCRRVQSSNQRRTDFSSRASLGYSAAAAIRSGKAADSAARLAPSTPRSVISPVTSRAGVTSKP